MTKKKTTNQMIEDLAISVQNGFTEVKQEIKEVRKEMESGFAEVRQEMKDEFFEVRKEMKAGFAEVNEMPDRVNGTLTQHGNRLDRLEDNMLVVKTKVGIR